MADGASQTQTQPKPITVTNPSLVPPGSAVQTKPGRPHALSVDTFSPVTQYGSYEFDRIIKQGEVLKRTRKTKSWKSIYIVLRPNLLSIYKDKHESKLRHQINLSELTAVARQKDPKRKEKHVFGLFSPSRNYHLEAPSDREAQEWVENIRREARMDEQEEEMYLASPGGEAATYRGFERSIDASISQSVHDDRATGYSSSDAEAFAHSQSLPKTRDWSVPHKTTRKASGLEYSGPEHGSFSDFSDSGLGATARMSALSLAQTDGRPSTSSVQQSQINSIYGSATAPPRPSLGMRSPSQMSGLALGAEDKKQFSTADYERVICQGWIQLLKSKSGVRQWKKVWMVLRPKQLAIYKGNEEYTAQLILPFPSIIDVVEIDPISKSKTACMQIISEERNYRFCALDEESLTKWLGAFKSLLSKRKTKASAAVPAGS